MATLSTKSEKLHQTKRKQLLNRSGCLHGVYEENNLTKRNQLSLQSSLFKQERRGVIAKVLSPIAWLANKLYAIEEKSKVEVANVYRHGLTLFTV